MITRILTRRAGYNYGSSLQAWAMQQLAEGFAIENELVDYDEYTWRGHLRLWLLRVAGWLSVHCALFDRMSRRWGFCWGDSHRHRQAFDRFDERRLKKSDRRYRSLRALRRAARHWPAAICGSDQIWNPESFDAAFFLGFMPDEALKIAYAPSFGTERIEPRAAAMIRPLIDRFELLSVREAAGARIIRELCGRRVPVVPDPTLLLTRHQWDRIAEPPALRSPYILCYFLPSTELPTAFVERLRAVHPTWEVINLPDNRFRFRMAGAAQPGVVSPEQFVGYLSQAQCVVTNSFHACVFSILYERPFYVAPRRAARYSCQFSRIRTLLDRLGLRGREIGSDGTGRPAAAPVDWPAVRQQLERYRAEGFACWARIGEALREKARR